MKDIQAIVTRVAELYAWVDQQIEGLESEPCRACGQCCDFSAYDHRLFVTTPELVHFQLQLDGPVRRMPAGRCPYQEQEKCTVYDIRFLGCRIFGCTRPDTFQIELTETALQRIKELCEGFDFAYQYVDLATALNLASPPVDPSSPRLCRAGSGEWRVASKAKSESKSSTEANPHTTK